MPGAGADLGVFAPPTLPPRWKLTKPAYSAQFIYLAIVANAKKYSHYIEFKFLE